MVEQLYKQYIDKLMAAVQPMNEYKNMFISHCKEFGPRISTGILVFDKALMVGWRMNCILWARKQVQVNRHF